MEDVQFHSPLKRPASFPPQHVRPKKLIKGAKDKGKGKLMNNYYPVNLFKQLASFYPQHGRPKKLIKGAKDNRKG
ncbi:hypothetical protein L6164_029934 [Bauhinia variegata]|uniref:Uncharacterized protein n=1 Tax=Bauhinia variegata TaxID=167791 RepID=A0ACB9LAM3_BAUVA|nr:hypothetical protein L6164_029934 [Bauhinia variegata]